MKREVNHLFFKEEYLSNEKYYIAGWLACADIKIVRDKPGFTIKTDINNVNVVNLLKNSLCPKHILKIKDKLCSISFISDKIKEDVDKIKEYIFSLDRNNSIFRNFTTGMMEASSIVLRNNCILFDSNVSDMSIIMKKIKIPITESEEFIKVCHTNALDLMGYMYENFQSTSSLYNYFYNLMHNMQIKPVKLEYTGNDLLGKKHFTDAGLDISIIEKDLDFITEDKNIMRFNTGICVNIPLGFWGMLCPRSSFSSSGFIMSNSFGVIDSSYRGIMKITLTKTSDKSFDDIKFPFSCAQLILIPQVFAFPEKVEEFSINSKTTRGDGGHGSTDAI